MSKILDQSVTEAGDGTWAFRCPGVSESTCGTPDGDPFTSTGWPTKKAATARGRQHFDEHKGISVAQTLEEFRADQGLVVDDAGTVSVKLEEL